MTLRDGIFSWSVLALVGVAFSRRAPVSAARAAPPVEVAAPVGDRAPLRLDAAWLAQREDERGSWHTASWPRHTGDEIQLSVRADQDLFVYVLDDSDGRVEVIFPARGAPPARVRANWSYAMPSPHLSWPLDNATHDRFVLVASRVPLVNPTAPYLYRKWAAGGGGVGLELPLRDGSVGAALSRPVVGDADFAVDVFDAR